MNIKTNMLEITSQLIENYDKKRLETMNSELFRVESGGTISTYVGFFFQKDKTTGEMKKIWLPWADVKKGDVTRYTQKGSLSPLVCLKNRAIRTGEMSNLIIIDLDSENHTNKAGVKSKCQGINLWYDLIKKHGEVKTLQASTPSGGLHVYFQYEKTLSEPKTKLGCTYKKIKDNVYEVDIDGGVDLMTDGKICSAPPSYDPIKKGGYKYINTHDVIKMPDFVHAWLLRLIEEQNSHKKTDNKTKKRKRKSDREVIKEAKLNYKKKTHGFKIPDTVYYNITDSELEALLKEVHVKHYTEYLLWVTLTAAVKSCNNENAYEIYDKVCKLKNPSKYNAESNEFTWDALEPTININYIVNLVNKQREAKDKKFTEVKFIRPVRDFIPITQKLKNTTIKEIDELTAEDIKIPKYNTVIINSGTGTAKTNSTMQKFKDLCFNEENEEIPKYKFLSIVSRTSLCNAHIEAWDRVWKSKRKLYSYKGDKNYDKQNVAITINSLHKLHMLKNINSETLKDYVLFLDEFQSFLGYLFDDSNMKKKKTRTKNLHLLLKIIKNVKYIIACDAHITDMCINFIRKLRGEDNIHFLINTKKPKKDLVVNNYDDISDMVKKIKDIQKKNSEIKDVKKKHFFTLTFDSLALQKEIHKMLKINNSDEDYVIINSESKPKDFDTIDISDLIENCHTSYTPSLVYGNSIITENKMSIFTFVTGKTLSPLEILQQMSRTRNVKEYNIHFHVTNKNLEYYYLEQVKNFYKQSFEIECENFKDLGTIRMNNNGDLELIDNIYSNIFYLHKFYKDALFSDFEFHLKKLLKKDGCIIKHIRSESVKIIIEKPKKIWLDSEVVKQNKKLVKTDDMEYIKQIVYEKEPENKKDHAEKKREYIAKHYKIPLAILKKDEEMRKAILYKNEDKHHHYFCEYSKPISVIKLLKQKNSDNELQCLLTSDEYTKIYIAKKFESKKLLNISCFGEISDTTDLKSKCVINDSLWNMYITAFSKKGKDRIKPKTLEELKKILFNLYKYMFGYSTYDQKHPDQIMDNRMLIRDYERSNCMINGKQKFSYVYSEPYFDTKYLKLQLKIYNYRNPLNKNMNEDFKDYFNIKELELMDSIVLPKTITL